MKASPLKIVHSTFTASNEVLQLTENKYLSA